MPKRQNPTEQNGKRTKASSISRRSILRKTAAGASTGIVGLSQPVFAREDTDTEYLEQLETLPKVQTVLTELNHNEIPHKEAAETTKIEGSIDVVVTEIEFGYGTLKIGKSTTRQVQPSSSVVKVVPPLRRSTGISQKRQTRGCWDLKPKHSFFALRLTENVKLPFPRWTLKIPKQHWYTPAPILTGSMWTYWILRKVIEIRAN